MRTLAILALNGLLYCPVMSEAATLYSIQALGKPPSSSDAGGLNELGQVAFSTTHSVGVLPEGRRPDDLYFFDGLQTHSLARLGGTYATVLDLNDHGVIVGASHSAGTYLNQVGDEFHYVWATVHTRGNLSLLPTPITRRSVANAINNAGDIAGTFVGEDQASHAFLRTSDGQFEDLGNFGGEFAHPVSIDERGAVLVNVNKREVRLYGEKYYYTTSGPLIYDNGEITWLPDSGNGIVFGASINEKGQVIGSFHFIPGQEAHAFVWDLEGGFRDLGSPGEFSRASDINDYGVIVGNSEPYYTSFDRTAYVYDDKNGRRALFDLVLPEQKIGTQERFSTDTAKWHKLEYATEINNQGQILGIGRFGGIGHQNRQVFLLTPIPEPRSIQIAFFLLTVLMAARRVR